jgi:NADH:ubiquinone oxidoreductase subunit 5 (subunit L)/multisubunit Na+/H+ antiporter MnhA subunit
MNTIKRVALLFVALALPVSTGFVSGQLYRLARALAEFESWTPDKLLVVPGLLLLAAITALLGFVVSWRIIDAAFEYKDKEQS